MKTLAKVSGTHICAVAAISVIGIFFFTACSGPGGKSPEASSAASNAGSAATPAAASPLSNGGSIARPQARLGACAAGFVEPPPELRDLFAASDVPTPSSYKLKYDARFYGYTFGTVTSEEWRNPNCKGIFPAAGEIKPVSQKVNEKLRQFISALKHNGKALDTALSLVSKLPNGLPAPQRIELCDEIECGTDLSSAKSRSFEFTNQAGLKQADGYTEVLLLNSALNEIRKIKAINSEEPELADSEIHLILGDALKAGRDKAKVDVQ